MGQADSLNTPPPSTVPTARQNANTWKRTNETLAYKRFCSKQANAFVVNKTGNKE